MKINLLDAIVTIAVKAGAEIMDVYQKSGAIDVELKSDQSPLTEADTRAHNLIVTELSELTPDIAVLSEESEAIPYEVRKAWSEYWLVDPLDGTKEFIDRNDEFTVNIALIKEGRAVLGVVHVPVSQTTYSGASDNAATVHDISPLGALKSTLAGETHAIYRSEISRIVGAQPLRVVASRRHLGEQLESFLDNLRKKFGELELLSMGSSLKICLLAEGKADIYPRMAPTCEWDTAAAQAVLMAAGGNIYDTSCNELFYNQKSELLNPFFIAVGDEKFPLGEVLQGLKVSQ